LSIPPRGIKRKIEVKKMPRGIPKDKSVKRQVLHRLKIARGHLDRVIEMVEKDGYCIDVIHQSLAVQAALKTIDQAVLKNHMQTCVADSIKKGKTDEVVDEVMKVIEKS
jgi:DNA-binding FrmR family transcriptional regulator